MLWCLLCPQRSTSAAHLVVVDAFSGSATRCSKRPEAGPATRPPGASLAPRPALNGERPPSLPVSGRLRRVEPPRSRLQAPGE